MHKLPNLLLASQSPRRRRMITWLGLSVGTTAAHIDEAALPDEHPQDQAVRLALAKARAINASDSALWILAADTIVDLDGDALGKPKDAVHATHTLCQLRARSHDVHTDVALFVPETDTMVTRLVTTSVKMRAYTDEEIAAYVATGDPMDKAGAYAIQHPQFQPVAQLNRCYANVVGLPLCAIVALLRELDVNISVEIPALCQAHLGYICPGLDEGVRV